MQEIRPAISRIRGGRRVAVLVGGAVLTLVVSVAVVLLVLAESIGLGRAPSRSAGILSPGMMAPDFVLSAQNRQTFRLSDYRGRAVFLAFVPSWTDTKTVAEVRSLRREIGNFDDAGAKVLLVSSSDAGAAERLHDGERLPFPLLIDTGNQLAKSWGVPQGDFRTTFVVNPAGKVRYRLSDAAVDPAKHGPQLLDVSKCCVDDVMAARAHGIGRAVGDFSLPRLDLPQSPMTTLFGAEAKATVVLFLSAKCPCSNAYNDRIAALAHTYEARGVRIIGVYANQDEPAEVIAKHARAHRFSFPILKDERALCADHFGASVTPEAFLLDDRHILRYAGRIDSSRDPAAVTTHDLQAAIEALLVGKEPVHRDTHAFGCAIVRQAV